MNDNLIGKSTGQMAKLRVRGHMLLVLLGIATIGWLVCTGVNSLNWFISFLVLGGLCLADHKLHRPAAADGRPAGHAAANAGSKETVAGILGRLAGDSLVLEDVPADSGRIRHLVFRKDGAIFLIDTDAHRGTVTDENAATFIESARENVLWLRNILKARFGVEPWIHASVVFLNAEVRVRRTVRGVDVVGAGYLERWLVKTRGNPQIAQKLWPQMKEVVRELFHPTSRRPAGRD